MKITHVLADGTVKDKLDGYVVKPETAPEFYQVLKREITKIKKEEALKNE